MGEIILKVFTVVVRRWTSEVFGTLESAIEMLGIIRAKGSLVQQLVSPSGRPTRWSQEATQAKHGGVERLVLSCSIQPSQLVSTVPLADFTPMNLLSSLLSPSAQ